MSVRYTTTKYVLINFKNNERQQGYMKLGDGKTQAPLNEGALNNVW
jgi:hypothetical protein